MKTKVILSNTLQNARDFHQSTKSKIILTLSRYSMLILKIVVKVQPEDTAMRPRIRCHIRILMKHEIMPIDVETTMNSEADAVDHCLKRARRTVSRRISIDGLHNGALQA